MVSSLGSSRSQILWSSPGYVSSVRKCLAPDLILGWLTVFAWIFTASAVQAGLANMTTALIIFHNEDYVLKRWHTTLIIFLWILLPLLPNIWFRKFLNVFENTAGACCILFFLINIITLSVLGKRSENSFVWKTLFHESGWKNPGIAVSVLDIISWSPSCRLSVIIKILNVC